MYSYHYRPLSLEEMPSRSRTNFAQGHGAGETQRAQRLTSLLQRDPDVVLARCV